MSVECQKCNREAATGPDLMCDFCRDESSLAPAQCCAAPCVTRIGRSMGKAFVVYLRDGTKITVGRDKTTKGPAWLEVKEQSKITAQHNDKLTHGATP